jgi:hypothetical protein
MHKASNYAYVAKKARVPESAPMGLFGAINKPMEADLNVFALTFDGMKEAEKNLAGGDSYGCKKCGAILNKFSVLRLGSEIENNVHEVKPN